MFVGIDISEIGPDVSTRRRLAWSTYVSRRDPRAWMDIARTADRGGVNLLLMSGSGRGTTLLPYLPLMAHNTAGISFSASVRPSTPLGETADELATLVALTKGRLALHDSPRSPIPDGLGAAFSQIDPTTPMPPVVTEDTGRQADIRIHASVQPGSSAPPAAAELHLWRVSAVVEASSADAHATREALLETVTEEEAHACLLKAGIDTAALGMDAPLRTLTRQIDGALAESLEHLRKSFRLAGDVPLRKLGAHLSLGSGLQVAGSAAEVAEKIREFVPATPRAGVLLSSPSVGPLQFEVLCSNLVPKLRDEGENVERRPRARSLKQMLARVAPMKGEISCPAIG